MITDVMIMKVVMAVVVVVVNSGPEVALNHLNFESLSYWLITRPVRDQPPPMIDVE